MGTKTVTVKISDEHGRAWMFTSTAGDAYLTAPGGCECIGYALPGHAVRLTLTRAGRVSAVRPAPAPGRAGTRDAAGGGGGA